MKRLVATTAILLGFLAGRSALAGDNPDGEFSATASIDTPSGTRSMAFDVVVSNPRSLADVAPLKKVLENGGQQALANAIRGGNQGQIKLGALVYPVDLVLAEKIEDGWRYFIVTTRTIQAGESEEGAAVSADYPFAVFGFDATAFDSGDGVIYTRAALSIDPGGHLHVAQYGGQPGTLTDITRVN
jgi:hypothetical protein